MIKIHLENKARYTVVGYNNRGGIIFSKEIDDRNKAIKYCKKNKDKYHFIEVDDNVIGHSIYNPYEGLD